MFWSAELKDLKLNSCGFIHLYFILSITYVLQEMQNKILHNTDLVLFILK